MTEAGWTSQRPNREGVYWFRWSVSSRPLIVSVAKDDCAWRVLEMGNQYDGALAGYSDGEWLGPITPDSYQQGRVAGLMEAQDEVWEHGCATYAECCDCKGHIVKGIERLIVDAQQAQDEKGVGDVHG